MKSITKVLAVVLALMVGMTFSFATASEVSAASKPSKVSISAKSADHNAVTVSWKAAKNAKSYQVYRATSKKGKYKKVATTSATSYTNKKLTTGKKYYYKVRALNGKTKGSFSSVKSATPKLKTPSVTASANTGAITMSWGKVNGAKGYQIYRATSKGGKYTKVKTTSSTSWTNSGLASGKTYYYKVRAYKKSGSKTLYSSYKSLTAATSSVHVHSWVPVYATRQVLVRTEAVPVDSVSICNGCGAQNPSIEHLRDHRNNGINTSTHVEYIFEYVPVYEEESYISHYKCSCGAAK